MTAERMLPTLEAEAKKRMLAGKKDPTPNLEGGAYLKRRKEIWEALNSGTNCSTISRSPEQLGDDIEQRRMAAFHELDRDQQRDAIKRMAAEGFAEYGIAAATKLAVEYVRLVLAERDAR